jgi:uncharacterized protein
VTTSATERLTLADMIIVDADVHVNDTPQALAPYCDLPWRKSLEALAQAPQRYLDVPGFAPKLQLDPPIPGGHEQRSVHTPRQMREELSALSIDIGVLYPDNLLEFACLPNIEYATALSEAYNRWLREVWLQAGESGLYGALLACPQNPEASAEAITRHAADPKVVGVYLPTAGVNPLWGHRKYDPIFAAAEAADLPVLLHSVTVITPAFPFQLDQFENHWARQMLGHAFAMMGNLVSMLHTGVPARYGRLKIAFTEAGLGWVPYMTWRADRYHAEYRRLVPFLTQRPSEYINERMWFATQPIEESDNVQDVATLIDLIGAERVIFASDWPHHDFDHPKAITNLPLSAAAKRKIMGENAFELFSRIPRPSAKIANV